MPLPWRGRVDPEEVSVIDPHRARKDLRLKVQAFDLRYDPCVVSHTRLQRSTNRGRYLYS